MTTYVSTQAKRANLLRRDTLTKTVLIVRLFFVYMEPSDDFGARWSFSSPTVHIKVLFARYVTLLCARWAAIITTRKGSTKQRMSDFSYPTVGQNDFFSIFV
jgi:hypothetical protein